MTIKENTGKKLHIIEAVNKKTDKVLYIGHCPYILYESFNDCSPISEEEAANVLNKLRTVYQKYTWARACNFFDRTVTISLD